MSNPDIIRVRHMLDAAKDPVNGEWEIKKRKDIDEK